MRDIYPTAKELHDAEVIERILLRAKEIENVLDNLCYNCKAEPRTYNGYYCSKECNEAYYTPRKRSEEYKPSVHEMQQRLREMGKRSRERLRERGKV